MASATNRNLPRNFWYRFLDIRRALQRESRMPASSTLRCAGSSRVWRRVSTIHPRMVLRVAQAPSPFSSLDKETASLRGVSETSGLAKDSSTASQRCRRMAFMRLGAPWPSWT